MQGALDSILVPFIALSLEGVILFWVQAFESNAFIYRFLQTS